MFGRINTKTAAPAFGQRIALAVGRNTSPEARARELRAAWRALETASNDADADAARARIAAWQS